MPDFNPQLLEYLACPHCGSEKLAYTREKVILCPQCRLCFPVRDGVPVLAVEEAITLNDQGELVDKEMAAVFSVIEGHDSGVTFRLSKGNCKVIGRRLDDSLKTQIFNVDFTMSLDEHTKTLIMNYLSKSRRGGSGSSAAITPLSDIGAYKRLPDLVLDDLAVSRLHAIIFFDETGAGILDLVSKNGTFVNGKEVEQALIKSGDVIEVGATKIKLTLK